MGVYNRDNRENQAFIYLNRHLLGKPETAYLKYIMEDLENHVYLEQDLG